MSVKNVLFYFGGGAFRDRFLWDGFTMSVPRQSSPDATRQFAVSTNVGTGGLEDVRAEDESLDLIQLWDNTTDPSIGLFERTGAGLDAIDPIVLWNGGSGSDYTYVVTEVLTGAATATTNALSSGSHSGTDMTGGSAPRLVCSPFGAAASWGLTIASTHNPTGKTRTGVLNFEFS